MLKAKDIAKLFRTLKKDPMFNIIMQGLTLSAFMALIAGNWREKTLRDNAEEKYLRALLFAAKQRTERAKDLNDEIKLWLKLKGDKDAVPEAFKDAFKDVDSFID